MAITLSKDHKKYAIELSEEKVTELHAIFFDPTMILDVAEMDPVNIDFGEGYVELRWDFEIRRRHHLVSLRIPEESQEGISPEIIELRKELFECRRQLETCQRTITQLSYVETPTTILSNGGYADLRNRMLFPGGSGNYPGAHDWAILAVMGTAYGKHTGLDDFFAKKEIQKAHKTISLNTPGIQPWVVINQAVGQYSGDHETSTACTIGEMNFNIEHSHISVTGFSIELCCDKSFPYSLGSLNMCAPLTKDSFRIVSHGIRSANSYVYLFRMGKHTPPETFEEVFDIDKICDEKEKELSLQFNADSPQAFSEIYCRTFRLKIYKVAVV